MLLRPIKAFVFAQHVIEQMTLHGRSGYETIKRDDVSSQFMHLFDVPGGLDIDQRLDLVRACLNSSLCHYVA